jgi:ATP-dependent DNA helicase RecQ
MTSPLSREVAITHLTQVLERLAGTGAIPRGDQVDAVHAIIQPSARVLVVQATGWGKSAVYWAATSALRAIGAGPTLVVSPLLALMRNQVVAATKAGLNAGTINSANVDEWDVVFAELDGNNLDVLLISPERLGNPLFAARLDELMARVGLVVIDEAHCISDWGFDFRPDYQRLARALLSTPTASVLATTATANKRVADDVDAQLGASTVVFRGTLARTSLELSVVPDLSPLQRYAWVAHALVDLPGSGIIYVLTVAEAERLSGFLQSCGYDAVAYTGQLDADSRANIEERLYRNDLKAVIATSALGMGYDKPDLGFCLHVGSPSTPVAYYQQVGRAGRGLDHAIAVLLSSEADERIWEFFATASIPDPEDVTKVLNVLSTNGPASVNELDTSTGVRRGRLETLLKILAVDEVVIKNGPKWSTTGKPYVHDTEKWDALRRVRVIEADIMRRYARGSSCLMELLQISLDDPSPSPCGRCSVCSGLAPGPGTKPDSKWLEAAREFSRGVDVLIEPRKIWPSGVSRRGKIKSLSPGRAVAFADDPGWSDLLRDMRNANYSRIPDELITGAHEVAKRWASMWIEKPVAIVVAPAFGAEAISNQQFANAMADTLGLPVFNVFSWEGSAVPAGVSSTPFVDHLEQVLQINPNLGIPAGPVILCATTMRTSWTQTVAAEMLYETGISTVFPFVIHRLP